MAAFWPHGRSNGSGDAMTDDEICQAIASGQIIEVSEFGKYWPAIVRLLGTTAGEVYLVYQVLDTDKGLPRNTALAGDRWRRNALSRLVVCATARKTSTTQDKLAKALRAEAIPAHMLQGIVKVLCAG